MKWFIATILLSLVSCVPESEKVLVVSSDFSEDELQAIYESAYAWEDAIDGLEINIRPADTGEMANFVSKPMLENSPRIGGAANDRKIEVYGKERYDLLTFKSVVMHEMGHYLGGVGHDKDGQCMSELVQPCLEGISRVDVEHVLSGGENGSN